MHFGSLPGLLLALAGTLLGGAPAHYSTGATAYASSFNTSALYSIMAQAATTGTATVQTAIITPTVAITATSAINGSASITATATTTITRATPVPIATAAPQASLQINPFDWRFLTGVPSPAMGPFAWLFLLLMIALLAAGVYFSLVKRPQWKGTNPVLYKAVNRFGQPALWIGGIGIVFLLFRIISLDPFNLRIWLYLITLAAIALIAWFVYWYRTGYPKELARYQKTQKARQYMPGSAKTQARPPSTPSSAASRSVAGQGPTTARPTQPQRKRKNRKRS